METKTSQSLLGRFSYKEKQVRPKLPSAYRELSAVEAKIRRRKAGRSLIEYYRDGGVGLGCLRGDSERLVVLATLDVRNALNSAWTNILTILRDDFHGPEYLMRMFDRYFRDMQLTIPSDCQLARWKEITAVLDPRTGPVEHCLQRILQLEMGPLAIAQHRCY
ncbi:hypothetical protein J6590_106404, partial [Homalodisca vitripennis]